MIQTNVFGKQTHRIREQTHGYRGGEGWEEEMGREFGADRYTLLHVKWVSNREQLDSTGNSAQKPCGSLDRRGVRGRTAACVCVAESTHSLPETITTLLICYVCLSAKLLQSCPSLCNPMNCGPPRLLCPWDSPGKKIEVGCHALLQGSF